MKLQRFEIAKSNFIELDMCEPSEIEQAFGKPLEVQLWHKIESVRTYEKPIKEEMLGQFFIELNELSKVNNKRLRDQESGTPGRMLCYEGYFSMHETKRDTLSSDRLAMRLYLFSKDDANETLSCEDLNSIFNLYRPKVESLITQKLDPEGKGVCDVSDLVDGVKTCVSDEYVAQKLIWFIKSSLQYKSADKVYYSPLFGLPPPYFKYAAKFDQVEIITKFNEELINLDSHDNGFIPVPVFKNVLEGELNVKTKIVEDFINGLRDTDVENSNAKSSTKLVQEVQSLDVNLITNSLKTSHLDFIVFIRKLSEFMQQNARSNNVMTLTNQRIVEQQREIQEAQEVTLSFEIDNAMYLKNPLASHETPNAFVYMKPNFACKETEQFVRTSHVKASSYPNWNHKSYNFTMPITHENRDFIQSGRTLEFEVYHASLVAADNLDVKEASHLIGVAFVPLAPLV